MIKAFLGGPVGPNPSEEVFDFYASAKLRLFELGFFCICPMDISRSIYETFGDKAHLWEELSDLLLTPKLDVALFAESSPGGDLWASKGSQREIKLCQERDIPVLIFNFEPPSNLRMRSLRR